MTVDHAFAGAGRQAGLELWRVENLHVVKQPHINGKFHTGDSYILLATTAHHHHGGLSHAIHFWLGAETSQDEAGVAAYKTVELDEALGGGPVQHREVQGHESQLFLSYFKAFGGIHYLPGGVSSGFRHVEHDQHPTRLLHLKGKRTVRCNEVPVALSSLNNGDVFILDKGLTIYLFFGINANRHERAKGIEVASRLNDDERGSRAKIVLVEDDPQNAEFWSHFGGFTTNLAAGEEDRDDGASAGSEGSLSKKLFRISNSSGLMEFVDITPGDGKLRKELLDTNDVFLVQSPGNISSKAKLFIWIGKKSNVEEKREATIAATRHLSSVGLPNTTSIERVSEGMETSAFKSEFAVWDSPALMFGIRNTGSAKPAAETDLSKEVQQAIARKAEEDAPVDDGSGKLVVWRVKNHEKVLVEPSHHGEFFSGDCYILHYSYRRAGHGEDEQIIYFWLGQDSTPDEKGSAALLTVALDDSLGGKPVQVRVVQGKEPGHFRHLFKGRMVIYQGNHDSGHSKGAMLFHVRGSTAVDTAGRQVSAQASSLNSQDTFILVTGEHHKQHHGLHLLPHHGHQSQHEVFVWYGKHSHQVERDVALGLATNVFGASKPGVLLVPVHEHSESAEFWAALGGRGEYPEVSHDGHGAAPRDPRLFHASNATGRFRVEGVDNFDQSDLNDEDVYILDTFTQLFVWVGSQANHDEKRKAMEFAERFVAEANDGRDHDIPIIRVNAGEEPKMFTNHFVGWDTKFTENRKFVDPYQAKLEAMRQQQAANHHRHHHHH